ncbi:MAG: hypothetical protein OXP71_01040 [Candidatus Poribacteria bacterium]|nr:hypothetical protein [Candidatus Poribacteria bacterium]
MYQALVSCAPQSEIEPHPPREVRTPSIEATAPPELRAALINKTSLSYKTGYLQALRIADDQALRNHPTFYRDFSRLSCLAGFEEGLIEFEQIIEEYIKSQHLSK